MFPHTGLDWLLVIVSSTISLVLWFVVYYGIFPLPKPSKQTLEPLTLLFVEQQSKYNDLVHADTQFMKDTADTLRESHAMVVYVYFDKSSLVKDPSKCRSAIGLVLSSHESKRKAEILAKSNTKFKILSLPAIECLGLTVPFKNFVSAFLIDFFWSRIFSQKDSFDKQTGEVTATLELYNFQDDDNHHINLYLPIANQEVLAFSSFRRPEYKRS